MDKYIFEFDRDCFGWKQIMNLSLEECMRYADQKEFKNHIKRIKIDEDASLEKYLDLDYTHELHRCFGFGEEENEVKDLAAKCPEAVFVGYYAWRGQGKLLAGFFKDYLKQVLNQVPDHEIYLDKGPIITYGQDDAMQVGESFGVVDSVYLSDKGDVFLNTPHFMGHHIDNVLFTEELGEITAAVREEVSKTNNNQTKQQDYGSK